MGAKKKVYQLLVGKPQGKRLLGRSRCRCVDNIKLDVGKIGWDDVDCIGLAQDRCKRVAPVIAAVNLRVL
jgi:hypothetical protein